MNIIGQFVSPGEIISSIEGEYTPGSGTYVRNKRVHSSVVGRVNVVEQEQDDGAGKQVKQRVVSVQQEKDQVSVPTIGDIVIAKVIRIGSRMANCQIICVNNNTLKNTFPGIIQIQDVRESDIDKVEIGKSFRPGDIVRAVISSLGDSKSFYLSTAQNELGVVYATSIAGASMIPVSWCEMVCPVTKTKESRKVARPDQ